MSHSQNARLLRQDTLPEPGPEMAPDQDADDAKVEVVAIDDSELLALGREELKCILSDTSERRFWICCSATCAHKG